MSRSFAGRRKSGNDRCADVIARICLSDNVFCLLTSLHVIESGGPCNIGQSHRPKTHFLNYPRSLPGTHSVTDTSTGLSSIVSLFKPFKNR